VRKNLSHKTVLSRRDESGMSFSTKKEQDLDPNRFKTRLVHQIVGRSAFFTLFDMMECNQAVLDDLWERFCRISSGRFL